MGAEPAATSDAPEQVSPKIESTVQKKREKNLIHTLFFSPVCPSVPNVWWSACGELLTALFFFLNDPLTPLPVWSSLRRLRRLKKIIFLDYKSSQGFIVL